MRRPGAAKLIREEEANASLLQEASQWHSVAGPGMCDVATDHSATAVRNALEIFASEKFRL